MNLTGPSSAGYHSIACFCECPRKFAFRFLLRLLSPIEPEATGKGTILHEYLRAHYLGEEPAIEALGSRYTYLTPKASELFALYKQKYPLESEPFRVLNAELEIESKIGVHLFTRRVDLIVEWPPGSGVVKFVDHKTAGRVTSRLRYAGRDASLMTQEIIGQERVGDLYPGGAYGGFVLNAIPSDGSMDYFRRQPILFPPLVVATWKQNIEPVLDFRQELLMNREDAWDWPMIRGSCEGRYGVCEYMDLCDYGRGALDQFAREK